MVIRRCENDNCEKELNKQKRFCSNKCKFEYYKTYEIGAFHNSKLRFKICSKGGKAGYIKSNKINKINKTGFWDFNVQSKGGKIGGKIGGVLSQKTLKEENRNFYNSEFQREMGNRVTHETHIKSGLASVEAKRNRSPYIYKSIHYASYFEMEFGANIDAQFGRLIIRKNFQVIIGNKPYDFLIEQYKCFVEPHQIIKFFRCNETKDSYYKQRRDNLNKKGYKDYNLVVIS